MGKKFSSGELYHGQVIFLENLWDGFILYYGLIEIIECWQNSRNLLTNLPFYYGFIMALLL